MKICPKCGSINITIPEGGMDLKMSRPDKCRECSYIGIFPETDDVKRFRKDLKKV